MTIHHTKHHQTYVTNLNAAYEKMLDAQAKGNIDAVIALQGAIKFNGGGHVNHSIFWQNLCPVSEGGGVLQQGPLSDAITAEFGSLDALQTKFNATTAAIQVQAVSTSDARATRNLLSFFVQGSGWGWLGYDKVAGKLKIATCANQDPLQHTHGLVPLLGIDVWEHAYYLQYKNVRPEYLKQIWGIINWKDVECRYLAAK
mmetsp:Transcript_32725/g.75145  ORF Transcript_32725/g.75145 Transcript_32725/m.75145 type:complete len:200 (+) Transcript_32725:300-899(+)